MFSGTRAHPVSVAGLSMPRCSVGRGGLLWRWPGCGVKAAPGREVDISRSSAAPGVPCAAGGSLCCQGGPVSRETPQTASVGFAVEWPQHGASSASRSSICCTAGDRAAERTSRRRYAVGPGVIELLPLSQLGVRARPRAGHLCGADQWPGRRWIIRTVQLPASSRHRVTPHTGEEPDVRRPLHAS